MAEPIVQPLYNLYRRRARIFLLAATIFAVPSLFCLGMVRWFRAVHHGTLPEDKQTWLIGCSVGGLIVFMMLLFGVVLSIVSRQGERALRAMRAGSYLVHWSYPPEIWHKFEVERAKADFAGMGWAFVFFLFPGLIYGFALAADRKGAAAKILAFAACIFAAATLGAVVIAIVAFIVRRSHRRLHQYPDAVLCMDAMYCGGEVMAWNCGGMRLYRATYDPAATAEGLAHVVILLGPSRAVDLALAAANLGTFAAAGRPAAAGSARVIRRIPVPPGHEAEAQQICQTMASQYLPRVSSPARAPAKPLFAAPWKHVATPVEREIVHPAPVHARAPRPPRSPRHWWMATAAMFAAGPVAFVLDVILGLFMPLHTPTPTLDKIATAGVFASMLSLVPLIVAIILTIRRRRHGHIAQPTQ